LPSFSNQEVAVNEPNELRCPDCEEPSLGMPSGRPLDRRDFIRVVGGAAALAAVGRLPASARAAPEQPAEKAAKPAEALIQELYGTFSDEQKKKLVLPFDNGAGKGKIATRLGMYNSALQNQKIGEVYTKAQQELIEKVMRSMVSGEDGYRRISRNGNWDTGGGMQGCGCHFFGEPVEDQKYAWVFTGHHLTIRADGDFMDGAAWGGPMYYGHSPNGYSDRNVFYFQTKSVLEVYKALDAKQRDKATVTGTPGEQAPSVRFRKPADQPGILSEDLTKDQRALIEKVMRDLLNPYRKEDADEVMEIVKKNGGLEKIHLAFYRDAGATDNERWHFWRLEGPGFVWNYRVLPHVHCYVNIATA
jgi:hypothetical protein